VSPTAQTRKGATAPAPRGAGGCRNFRRGARDRHPAAGLPTLPSKRRQSARSIASQGGADDAPGRQGRAPPGRRRPPGLAAAARECAGWQRARSSQRQARLGREVAATRCERNGGSLQLDTGDPCDRLRQAKRVGISLGSASGTLPPPGRSGVVKSPSPWIRKTPGGAPRRRGFGGSGSFSMGIRLHTGAQLCASGRRALCGFRPALRSRVGARPFSMARARAIAAPLRILLTGHGMGLAVMRAPEVVCPRPGPAQEEMAA